MVQPTESGRGVRTLVVVAALFLIAGGLRAAAPALVPLLLALFLAIVASPAISWLHRRGAPITIALVIVTMGILGGAAVLSVVIATSAGELSQSMPAYEVRAQEMAEGSSAWLEARGLDFGVEDLQRLVDPAATVRLAGNFLAGLGAILGNGLLVAFLVVLILLDAVAIPTKLAAMTSDPEGAQEKLMGVRKQVDSYFGVLTVLSAVTGVLVFVFLALLGVDLALFWGLLAFLLNFIPNVGSIIAAVPATLLTLVQLGPGTALAVAAGYLTINMVIGNLVQPRLMGEGLGLSTLTVFVSLILWGFLLGPVGMLVSVPLTSAIRLALHANESTRPISIFLANEDVARQTIESNLREQRSPS